MKKQLIFILLTSICISFSSCSKIIMTYFGMKNPKYENEKAQNKTLKKWDIKPDYSFEIVEKGLDSLEKSHRISNLEKDSFLSIPFFKVYDNSGKIVCAWEQCSGNIKDFTFFKSDTVTPFKLYYLNENLFIENDFEILKGLGRYDELNRRVAESDYTIVAYWTGYMGHFSKVMLQEIQNFKSRTSQKVTFVTVNFSSDEDGFTF